MNQGRQRLRVESNLVLYHRRDQFRAGLVFRVVVHVLARESLEILGVGWSQERALVMIKPPGHFWRVGILEIDDDILIAVEKRILPGVFCFVGHPAEAEFSFGVEMFPVETVEKRRRSGAIEAAIVKAESDLGHRERISLTSSGAPRQKKQSPLRCTSLPGLSSQNRCTLLACTTGGNPPHPCIGAKSLFPPPKRLLWL